MSLAQAYNLRLTKQCIEMPLANALQCLSPCCAPALSVWLLFPAPSLLPSCTRTDTVCQPAQQHAAAALQGPAKKQTVGASAATIATLVAGVAAALLLHATAAGALTSSALQLV